MKENNTITQRLWKQIHEEAKAITDAGYGDIPFTCGFEEFKLFKEIREEGRKILATGYDFRFTKEVEDESEQRAV